MTYKNDKNISNISFINKDFESLWTEILALIPKLTNKWVPSEANESDPLAVLLKEQAIMTDKINYNVDKNILELFPQSLTQLRSAYDVYNSMGYYPDWYVSATVDLTLSRNGKVLIVENSKSSTDNGEALFIDVFTSFSDSESKTVYVTTKAKNLTINESVVVPAIQGTALDFAVDNDRCITTDYLDAQNRIYFAESNVAQNGIFISEFEDYRDLRSSDSAWKRVDNLSQELGGQKVYKFGVDAVNNACYIQFPNDIGSLIGSGLYIKYIKSDGVNGNITIKTITQFLNDITIKNEAGTTLVAKNNSSVKINDLFAYTTNLLGTTNGKDPMTIDEMNLGYDKVKNVFNTLVTLLDYKNYLYNYKDSNSRNIVSNIQVSDRSNDLYQSYTVKSFDITDNINVDIVKSNVNNTKVVDENGQITVDNRGQITAEDVLTAYNIRFYPLAYSSDVASLGNFNNTFTQITDTQNIDNAIQEAKSLNHDVLESGSPVILTYDLDGSIYLNDKVSQIDANQIKNKVVQALWARFNSRQLGFGEMPDYGELVDTIKSADDRISYVALNPITTYKQKEDNTFDKYYSSLDIIKRSILAGITPWSERNKDINLKFGQVFDDLTKINGIDFSTIPLKNSSTGEMLKDSYLSTQCLSRIDASIDYKDRYILNILDNEQLSLFQQSYTSDVTYTNYMYYKYTSSNNNKRVFLAGNVYKLVTGETITLKETRTGKVIKTLQTGDIISTSFSLKPFKDNDDYVSIGTDSISVMKAIEYVCKTKENVKLYFSDKQFFTQFINQLDKGTGGAGISITIPTGSYVIRISFDDYSNVTSFEIIGEGSTISTTSTSGLTAKDRQTLISNYSSINIDLAFLQEYGDLQSIDQVAYNVNSFCSESQSKDFSIKLRLNSITSIGAGYEVCFYKYDQTIDYDDDQSDLSIDPLNNKYRLKFALATNIKNSTVALDDTKRFDIAINSSSNGNSIGKVGCAYRLQDVNGKPSDWQFISFGDIEVYGQYGLVLNNIASSCKLQKKTYSESSINHQHNIIYNYSTSTGSATASLVEYNTSKDNDTKYFNSNKKFSIGLQQHLILDEYMNIYVYAEGANSDKSYIDDTSGVQLPVYVDSSNKQLPIIVRVVKSSNDVAYILTTTVTSNTDALLKIDGVGRYYQPVLYTADAKVYVMNFIGTSTTDPVSEGGANVEGHTTFKAGDVCSYSNNKYAYNSTESKWTKLDSTNWQSLVYTSLINIYNNRSNKSKKYVELTNDYIYDIQFDPTYVPTDPINNPKDTNTYFNKNHILNRYIMAQLKGYNTDSSEATSSNPLPNLKISDLSIIK